MPRGAVTDDTEMSLALGNAICKRAGFNLEAVANAFAAWLRSGPRDCGHTCRRGIRNFLLKGELCVEPSESQAGNGALMRNLPVILATLGDSGARERHSLAQAHLTHFHHYSDAAILALGEMVSGLILGLPASEIEAAARGLVAAHPVFAHDGYSGPAGGYVVETVCTVLHCFFDELDYEACVVRTVNRGGDADTTGAIAGMLAGARSGAKSLPSRWLRRLEAPVRQEIERQSRALLALSPAFSAFGRR